MKMCLVCAESHRHAVCDRVGAYASVELLVMESNWRNIRSKRPCHTLSSGVQKEKSEK